MTGEEAMEQVLHELGKVRRSMESHGWRLRLFGRAELSAVEVGPIETPGPDSAAEAEALAVAMSGCTGNLCENCHHPTRPSGGCEVCPNCGQTSSCG